MILQPTSTQDVTQRPEVDTEQRGPQHRSLWDANIEWLRVWVRTYHQGAYNQQEGPLPTSQKPLPTNLAIKLLLHNAQALFSPPCSSYFAPMCYGPTPGARPMCSCWKQAQPAVATPGVPWYQMVTMTGWLICAVANRGLKTRGKHAQCLHPGCAKPDLSAGVCFMSVDRFLRIWHANIGFSQWSAI